MPLVSIRLPDDVDEGLAREAQRTQRPKSEIARDAIVDYLLRTERERFLAEIARAAPGQRPPSRGALSVRPAASGLCLSLDTPRPCRLRRWASRLHRDPGGYRVKASRRRDSIVRLESLGPAPTGARDRSLARSPEQAVTAQGRSWSARRGQQVRATWQEMRLRSRDCGSSLEWSGPIPHDSP